MKRLSHDFLAHPSKSTSPRGERLTQWISELGCGLALLDGNSCGTAALVDGDEHRNHHSGNNGTYNKRKNNRLNSLQQRAELELRMQKGLPMMTTSVLESLAPAASVDEAGEIASGLVRTQVYGKPEGDGTFKHVYCSGHGNVEHGSMVVLCGFVVLLVGYAVVSLEYGSAVGTYGAGVGTYGAGVGT